MPTASIIPTISRESPSALAAEPDRVVLGARTFQLPRSPAQPPRQFRDARRDARTGRPACLRYPDRPARHSHSHCCRTCCGSKPTATTSNSTCSSPCGSKPCASLKCPSAPSTSRQPLVALQPAHRLDEDLLRAAALQFRIADDRRARHPGLLPGIPPAGKLAASQALGRLLAVAFNYSMVRRAVFASKLRHASVLPKYLLLVCLSGRLLMPASNC